VAIKRPEKEEIIEEVRGVAQRAHSAVVSEYRGLTVAQLTGLRKSAREQSVYIKVVRNTLAKRALEGTDFDCLSDALVGPTVLAFALDDPGAGARLLKDFAKANDKLVIRALAVGGVQYPADQIDRLANLPTREQALGLVASVLQAPVVKFARTLNEFPSMIARAVAAVKDQKAA
jgi:large subunit ribosomal protein L10